MVKHHLFYCLPKRKKWSGAFLKLNVSFVIPGLFSEGGKWSSISEFDVSFGILGLLIELMFRAGSWSS